MGDSADGFPGPPRLRREVGGALLQRYGHIEAIPDDGRTWDVPGLRSVDRLAATLAAGREVAACFKVLATLRTDADVGTVDDWRWTGPTDAFGDWCERLGSPRLLVAPGAREHKEIVVTDAVLVETVGEGSRSSR